MTAPHRNVDSAAKRAFEQCARERGVTIKHCHVTMASSSWRLFSKKSLSANKPSRFVALMRTIKMALPSTAWQTFVHLRCAPLAVSIPKFPLHRELLKEIAPELKHVFLEVSSGNRTLSDASQMGKGTTRFFDIGQMSESGEMLRWMRI